MALFKFVSIQAFSLAWFLHMLVASIWYSGPVFGNACKIIAFGQRKDRKVNRIGLITAAVGTAIAMPFFCLILNAGGCKSAGDGALWGAALGIFFDAGMNISHVLFEERPFALFAIHRGHHVVSLILIGSVLGACCGAA